MFTALKGSNFQFLFAITAAGTVPHVRLPKKSSRTSSIAQIIFSFWSFPISGPFLINMFTALKHVKGSQFQFLFTRFFYFFFLIAPFPDHCLPVPFLKYHEAEM